MIPRVLHYCWFGGGDIPSHLRVYMDSWRRVMPAWEVRCWSEETFSIADSPLYVREAYALRKYAFVSDYVRLWALERYGGVYLDTDVEVLKDFSPLLGDTAFMGLEESLAHLPGTCVMGCEAHCAWVQAMLGIYDSISFLEPDGTPDLTTNVQRMGRVLCAHGFVPSRQSQYIGEWGLRIYTYDYFSPITSTRVLRKTSNTYSIHHLEASWQEGKKRVLLKGRFYYEVVNLLVQIKRWLTRK